MDTPTMTYTDQEFLRNLSKQGGKLMHVLDVTNVQDHEHTLQHSRLLWKIVNMHTLTLMWAARLHKFMYNVRSLKEKDSHKEGGSLGPTTCMWKRPC